MTTPASHSAREVQLNPCQNHNRIRVLSGATGSVGVLLRFCSCCCRWNDVPSVPEVFRLRVQSTGTDVSSGRLKHDTSSPHSAGCGFGSGLGSHLLLVSVWGCPGCSTVQKHEHQVDLFEQKHQLCGRMMDGWMMDVLLMDGWMNEGMKALQRTMIDNIV